MAMPSIALVTPSLDQGRFLETALRSVLDQDYPTLEYVVADGGSTDGSVEIIERYADRLAAWWSGPDEGHADAVNRGFERTTGDVMGWLNADDALVPGALHVVSEIFERFPEIEWLTAGFQPWLDELGRLVVVGRTRGFHRDAFRLGLHGARQAGRRLAYVPQESTFWRRSLWERAGGRLDPSYEPAADFELWTRFFEHAELHVADTVIGMFRAHSAQRSARERERYHERARAVLVERHGGRFGRARDLGIAVQAALPDGVTHRVPLGWRVPYVGWSRDSGWRVGRRPLV